MDIRQFRARNLQEALGLIHRELGPHVEVLQTRQIWDGWWRGLWGGRQVEVIAAARPPATPPEWTRSEPGDGTKSIADATWEGAFRGHAPPAHHEDFRSRFRNALSQSMGSAAEREGSTLGTPSRVPQTSDASFRLFAELIDAEFTDEQARNIVGEMLHYLSGLRTSDWDESLRRLGSFLVSKIPFEPGIQIVSGARSVVAFVGPTGVGKTTTIAKLAAHFHLREKHRVGLITVDTFRIGAVEQLRTYADILDLPVEVVSSPREMREATRRLSDCDLILIDTAGRSPVDELQLKELECLLREAQATATLLVASAAMSLQLLHRTREKFSSVAPSGTVLTKVDELGCLGSLFGFLRSSPVPFVYLTNGQNVPDDIQSARAEVFHSWLLPTRGNTGCR